MSTDDTKRSILGALATRGVLSSHDLQRIAGASQASVSRAVSELAGRVATIGRARATRYALPQPIRGLSGRQPIWWTDADGSVREFGELHHLHGGLVHVDSPWAPFALGPELPWYLSPLRARGFLGRLHARRLVAQGLHGDPERWTLEDVLYAAAQLHDAPGAISIGAPPPSVEHSPLPTKGPALAAALDARADEAIESPPGSSAAGEQPKFIAHLADGRHVLVKFTPPRTTPGGQRWHDLLHAEALAGEVLAEFGVPVAKARIVCSRHRTYLISERFDRIGRSGRIHVVAIGDVHDAFVRVGSMNWVDSARALAGQRRLEPIHVARIDALHRFGRLIGNTDMHSGNLGLLVELEDIRRARFSLAPVYDMLPMRWRPEPMRIGDVGYTPFEPDRAALSASAIRPARLFWQRLAGVDAVSAPLRRVAADMAGRLG